MSILHECSRKGYGTVGWSGFETGNAVSSVWVSKISRQRFIRFSQGVFIVGGCVLLTYHPSFFPSYYRSQLMGLTAFVYAFCIQLPALVFRISPNTSHTKEKVFFRERFQVALCIGFLLGGLGSLGLWGLYQVGIPYDKLIHFSFSALIMVSGTYMLQVWYGWSLKKTAIVLGLVIGASGIVWEFIEFFSDRWLHFGYFGHLFDRDSSLDVLSNVLGAIVGGIIIARRQWFQKK